ncbi:MAG: endonuclease/exonuclease/phosphatase [Flavobacteriaceae bacterium]|nr:endonuclease/exonuclease/phosphatase [Flavobacteriaceae bacterium]|tara:strand:- start:38806 stop:39783 length:978 start_codon:yes stop_codon:yes gene_type:complete
MKRLIKNIGLLLLSLVFLFVIFFFWASAPSLSKEAYAILGGPKDKMISSKDSVFSIVTYNIGYLSGMTNNTAEDKPKSLFDQNLEWVKQKVRDVNPDIIALQEIDYKANRSHLVNQQEELVNLGYPYFAKAINWDETYLPFPYWPPSKHFGKVISGQSIVSKYPLKEQERIVLQRVADAPFYRDPFYLERLAQVVKVELNGQDVVLINVHLEAFDKLTRLNQMREVMLLLNRFKDRYPTILLGDFNSKYQDVDAGIQEFLDHPELSSAALNNDTIGNTFNSRNPYKRIDYVFFTKNTIEEVSGRVLNEFGEASDHLPVLMKFRLK